LTRKPGSAVETTASADKQQLEIIGEIMDIRHTQKEILQEVSHSQELSECVAISAFSGEMNNRWLDIYIYFVKPRNVHSVSLL
jgi:hypothetical protein